MNVVVMAYCTSGVIQTSLFHELELTDRHKTGREENSTFPGVPIYRVVDGTYSFTREE